MGGTVFRKKYTVNNFNSRGRETGNHLVTLKNKPWKVSGQLHNSQLVIKRYNTLHLFLVLSGNPKLLPFLGGLLNRSLSGTKMVDNRRRVTLQEQIFNAEMLRFRSKKQRDSHTFAYKIYRHGLPSTPESSLWWQFWNFYINCIEVTPYLTFYLH